MRFCLTVAFSMLAGVAFAQQTADAVQPESSTAGEALAASGAVAAALAAKADGVPVETQSYMVAAANPLAVQAGVDVLAKGGTAADALVAVQTVLGLVEPQSSGLGGGAFLVWYNAASQELTTLDGRETAPLAVTPTLFQNEDGSRMGFFDAVVGGRSVGTPGTPALLAEVHARWGNQPWPSLFEAGMELASTGFEVSPRLAGLIERDAERLAAFGPTADYFLPGGTPLTVGATLQNPDYAATLGALAVGGAEAIYTGQIAESIVTTVQQFSANPGVLSALDLAVYQVKERPPVCATYRAHE
ncbi:MAG: gamma-glutamyltransferase, partial [Pseudomonadota bacterium]